MTAIVCPAAAVVCFLFFSVRAAVRRPTEGPEDNRLEDEVEKRREQRVQ